MKNLKNLKIAIVYDRVNKWGGAERVLLALHEMFPNAPLFTSVYDKKNASWARIFPKIYTSFLQKIPLLNKKHELLGWIMPLAFESFDFSDFDLVISVTSEAAKGIITKPSTFHICYMLTPTRYLWSHKKYYFKNKILEKISKPVIDYLKQWDLIASCKPDKIIAISTAVKNRIKKYYQKDSEVIFPPVDVPLIMTKDYLDGEYYLIVSRLVGYKRVDLAVEVFNELNLPLMIVGTGSDEKKLKYIANSNISFTGMVSDEELMEIYKKSKAFIMPQEEDFGIAGVEAQYYGKPVISFKKGGSLDTVIEGRTGMFFNEQTKASLTSAIALFDKMSFNHNYIRRYAEKYNKDRFKRELQKSLIRAYIVWRGRNKVVAKIT
ncbi:MAG: Glycosyl transferase group 1 [Parcubacteria group bacterium GW2011_GWA1_38_7]|nr:MAG: Glycosyl transferase group 1 [Parcubacteria group bacterium GW2011_GWA1_38_7]